MGHGAAAFIVLRGLSGLAAALYDPAARGYIVDATAPEERGEAFGLYAAFQTSGIFVGPLAGALAAGIAGTTGAVFLVGAAAQAASRRLPSPADLHERRHRQAWAGCHALGLGELCHPDVPVVQRRAGPKAGPGRPPPRSLANRDIAAVLCLNLGVYFDGGAWEVVVWSLVPHGPCAGYGLRLHRPGRSPSTDHAGARPLAVRRAADRSEVAAKGGGGWRVAIHRRWPPRQRGDRVPVPVRPECQSRSSCWSWSKRSAGRSSGRPCTRSSHAAVRRTGSRPRRGSRARPEPSVRSSPRWRRAGCSRWTQPIRSSRSRWSSSDPLDRWRPPSSGRSRLGGRSGQEVVLVEGG